MGEANAEVAVHDLRYVRDYIGKNHEFAHEHPEHHGVEFMFYCTLKLGTGVSDGYNPDKRQISIEWIQIDRLNKYNLYPKVLRELIKPNELKGPVYLGDVK